MQSPWQPDNGGRPNDRENWSRIKISLNSPNSEVSFRQDRDRWSIEAFPLKKIGEFQRKRNRWTGIRGSWWNSPQENSQRGEEGVFFAGI